MAQNGEPTLYDNIVTWMRNNPLLVVIFLIIGGIITLGALVNAINLITGIFPTPTFTPSPTSTFTPTFTSTFTSTFTPSPTPTFTPTPTNTPIPTPVGSVDIRVVDCDGQETGEILESARDHISREQIEVRTLWDGTSIGYPIDIRCENDTIDVQVIDFKPVEANEPYSIIWVYPRGIGFWGVMVEADKLNIPTGFPSADLLLVAMAAYYNNKLDSLRDDQLDTLRDDALQLAQPDICLAVGNMHLRRAYVNLEVTNSNNLNYELRNGEHLQSAKTLYECGNSMPTESGLMVNWGIAVQQYNGTCDQIENSECVNIPLGFYENETWDHGMLAGKINQVTLLMYGGLPTDSDYELEKILPFDAFKQHTEDRCDGNSHPFDSFCTLSTLVNTIFSGDNNDLLLNQFSQEINDIEQDLKVASNQFQGDQQFLAFYEGLYAWCSGDFEVAEQAINQSHYLSTLSPFHSEPFERLIDFVEQSISDQEECPPPGMGRTSS